MGTCTSTQSDVGGPKERKPLDLHSIHGSNNNELKEDDLSLQDLARMDLRGENFNVEEKIQDAIDSKLRETNEMKKVRNKNIRSSMVKSVDRVKAYNAKQKVEQQVQAATDEQSHRLTKKAGVTVPSHVLSKKSESSILKERLKSKESDPDGQVTFLSNNSGPNGIKSNLKIGDMNDNNSNNNGRNNSYLYTDMNKVPPLDTPGFSWQNVKFSHSYESQKVVTKSKVEGSPEQEMTALPYEAVAANSSNKYNDNSDMDDTDLNQLNVSELTGSTMPPPPPAALHLSSKETTNNKSKSYHHKAMRKSQLTIPGVAVVASAGNTHAAEKARSKWGKLRSSSPNTGTFSDGEGRVRGATDYDSDGDGAMSPHNGKNNRRATSANRDRNSSIRSTGSVDSGPLVSPMSVGSDGSAFSTTGTPGEERTYQNRTRFMELKRLKSLSEEQLFEELAQCPDIDFTEESLHDRHAVCVAIVKYRYNVLHPGVQVHATDLGGSLDKIRKSASFLTGALGLGGGGGSTEEKENPEEGKGSISHNKGSWLGGFIANSLKKTKEYKEKIAHRTYLDNNNSATGNDMNEFSPLPRDVLPRTVSIVPDKLQKSTPSQENVFYADSEFSPPQNGQRYTQSARSGSNSKQRPWTYSMKTAKEAKQLVSSKAPPVARGENWKKIAHSLANSSDRKKGSAVFAGPVGIARARSPDAVRKAEGVPRTGRTSPALRVRSPSPTRVSSALGNKDYNSPEMLFRRPSRKVGGFASPTSSSNNRNVNSMGSSQTFSDASSAGSGFSSPSKFSGKKSNLTSSSKHMMTSNSFGGDSTRRVSPSRKVGVPIHRPPQGSNRLVTSQKDADLYRAAATNSLDVEAKLYAKKQGIRSGGGAIGLFAGNNETSEERLGDPSLYDDD